MVALCEGHALDTFDVMSSNTPRSPHGSRAHEMVGQRFVKLVVTGVAPSKNGRNACVFVDCDCGTKGRVVLCSSLLRGVTKSCGCARRRTAVEKKARRDAQRKRWANDRRARGRCLGCGARRRGKAKCKTCLRAAADKQAALRRSRASVGGCELCKLPRVMGNRCLRHWFYRMAASCGSARRGPLFQEMFERQGGRCAFTGVVLVPGENASLDHIIPLSRGGDDSIENLHWVTKEVNRVKADLTAAEFVEMCRTVVSTILVAPAGVLAPEPRAHRRQPKAPASRTARAGLPQSVSGMRSNLGDVDTNSSAPTVSCSA